LSFKKKIVGIPFWQSHPESLKQNKLKLKVQKKQSKLKKIKFNLKPFIKEIKMLKDI